MPRYTGGEIIAEYLAKEEVPYIVGIPGHGIIPFLDPFRDRRDKIKVIQVRHEQSAVHLLQVNRFFVSPQSALAPTTQ
jgi:acetolactate synthase-1/2/3 large subunit